MQQRDNRLKFAGKLIFKIGIIMLFILVLITVAGLIVSKLGDRIFVFQTYLDNLVWFFLGFRLGIYGLIWRYWPVLSTRAGDKRDWTQQKIDQVIAERHKLVPWILVMELFILSPVVWRAISS